MSCCCHCCSFAIHVDHPLLHQAKGSSSVKRSGSVACGVHKLRKQKSSSWKKGQYYLYAAPIQGNACQTLAACKPCLPWSRQVTRLASLPHHRQANEHPKGQMTYGKACCDHMTEQQPPSELAVPGCLKASRGSFLISASSVWTMSTNSGLLSALGSQHRCSRSFKICI